MGNFAELKDRIIEYLLAQKAFENVNVVSAFTEKAKAFPIKTPVISVEISGAELTPAGLGDYVGGNTPQYGMSALVTLKFGINHTSAKMCSKLFESLCDALFSSGIIGVLKIRQTESVYDTKTAACLLYAEAAVKAVWLIKEREERLFHNIELRNN